MSQTAAEVLRLERVGKVYPGTPPVEPVRDSCFPTIITSQPCDRPVTALRR